MLQVGIIPTDTFPAFVCDIENKGAVTLLYELKGISATKKLSILCHNMRQISKYTLGFPVSTAPGQPDFFRIAMQILPGPVSFGGEKGGERDSWGGGGMPAWMRMLPVASYAG